MITRAISCKLSEMCKRIQGKISYFIDKLLINFPYFLNKFRYNNGFSTPHKIQ